MIGLICLVSGLIFIPLIGNCPLFDWDEVNFAECAREMVVSGNYAQVQLNFQPFWEKPPFFIWMQALSMNVFGVNEFAARFPNAVCSIASLLTLFMIGKKFHSQKFGLLWCLIYVSLMLPHLYFRSGIIDPWFNLFILLSLFNVMIFINNPRGRRELLNAVLAGLFLGLAVLTKGPVALLIVGLTVLAFVFWTKNFKALYSKLGAIFFFSTVLFSLSWFIFEWQRGNGQVIKEFINYQIRLFRTGDAGHEGSFAYHFIVLLLGCFPASFVFIASYRNKADLTPYQNLFRKVFICLFWVVLILFSVVKTKIVHYSSLCYFPITFIATLGIINYFHKMHFGFALKWFYWIVSILIALAFILLGFIDKFKSFLIHSDVIKDEFVKENLKAEVHWSGFEFLLGFAFLLGAALVINALTKKKMQQLYIGFTVLLVFVYTGIVVIIPKVELYTQHAAIEFYKVCAQSKCYVETHSFKSYAYLFYSNRQPEDYQNPSQLETIGEILLEAEKVGHTRYSFYANANVYWMKHGKIDRPAYMVAKINQEDEMLAQPHFTKLYDLNGYSFFVRMP